MVKKGQKRKKAAASAPPAQRRRIAPTVAAAAAPTAAAAVAPPAAAVVAPTAAAAVNSAAFGPETAHVMTRIMGSIQDKLTSTFGKRTPAEAAMPATAAAAGGLKTGDDDEDEVVVVDLVGALELDEHLGSFLIDLLKETDPKRSEWVRQCLEKLCSKIRLMSSSRRDAKGKLIGSLLAVVSCMKNFPENVHVQEQGCRFFDLMIRDDDENTTDEKTTDKKTTGKKTTGKKTTGKKTEDKKTTDKKTTIPMAFHLWHQFHLYGGLDVVKAASDKFPDNRNLQLHAIGAISHSLGNLEPYWESGGKEIFDKFVQVHGGIKFVVGVMDKVKGEGCFPVEEHCVRIFLSLLRQADKETIEQIPLQLHSFDVEQRTSDALSQYKNKKPEPKELKDLGKKLLKLLKLEKG